MLLRNGQQYIYNGLIVSGSSQITGSLSVSDGITGSLFGTASWALNALTASFALNAGGSTINTGSFLITASAANTTITFTKGDGSTFDITVSQSGSVATASYALFAETASYSNNSTSASYATTASYWSGSILNAESASYASTASYVLNAVSASFATTASYALNATSASYAETSSYALNAISTSYAATASYAVTSSYGLNPNISGSLNNVDAVIFNTSASVSIAPGVLTWDNGEGTLQLGLVNGNVTAQIGQDLYQYVYNDQGTTLTKGQVVYVSGSQGNRIAVKLASATAEQGSAQTLGLVAETINAGSQGWVQTEGVMRKLNTTGLVGGQLLYLSSSAGQYTQTKPQSPLHEVRLGYAERIDNIVGSIYIKIDNGYESDELHDVILISGSDGDLLVRSGSFWINTKQLTGSYGLTGSLQADSFTGSLFGTSSWATNALTASSADNFTVRGTLTAQTIVTQVITSSTDFVTGSTRFGSLSSNTHQFTGSVSITGSLNSPNITGSLFGTSSWAQNAISSSFATTASYWSGSILNAESASFATTASYVLNAVSSSFASTASYWSGSILNAESASFASTASIATSASFATTASYWSGSIINAESASFASTASYWSGSIESASYALNSTSASYALTASYALNAGAGGLKTKAGSIANTSFGGSPRTASVTFSTAFSDTNYAIVVTGEDSRAWSIQNKLSGSFVINSNSNVALAGTTYWIATAYGETN